MDAAQDGSGVQDPEGLAADITDWRALTPSEKLAGRARELGLG